MDHSCFKCGETSPVKFSISGQHVKASCGACGHYIKFVPTGAVPDFTESKNKIWEITQDLTLINNAKTACDIQDELTGKYKNIAYHNLYRYIVQTHFV